MIKLNRIKVSNFKNIKDADVTFGDFNVIVGPNNSGKSNFLQVLGFLEYLIFSSEEDMFAGNHENRWGIFRQVLNATFQLGLADNELPVEKALAIEIEFENNFTLYYYNVSIRYPEPWIVSIKDGRATTPARLETESFFYKEKNRTGKAIRLFQREQGNLYLHKELKVFENVIGSAAKEYLIAKLILPLLDRKKHMVTSNALGSLLHILKSPIYYMSPSQLGKAPRDRVTSEKHRQIAINLDEVCYSLSSDNSYLKALKNILSIESLEFSRLDVSSEDMEAIFKRKLYGVIISGKLKYYHWLSDGTLVLLALITAVFAKETSCFLIEEPENSIHPKALRDLLNFMREHEGEKQFIITTHSPIVVNMAKPEEIILAEINKEDGTSTIKNVPNPKELRRKLRDGFTDMSDEIFFYYGKDDFEIL